MKRIQGAIFASALWTVVLLAKRHGTVKKILRALFYRVPPTTPEGHRPKVYYGRLGVEDVSMRDDLSHWEGRIRDYESSKDSTV